MPEPHLPVLARTLRGIEWIAAAEIRAALGISEIAYGHRELRFSLPELVPELLALGTVDDVFLVAGEIEGITGRRESLARAASLGPDLDELARLAGTIRIEQLSDRAFRLRDAVANDSIASWCEERRIDHAWMPEGRRFADLKLLAMDMDSTLITIECIDELGDLAGRKAEIAAITAQAMRGEIDYPESLTQRVALLSGLQESALRRVYDERLRLTSGAEALLAACKQHGVKLLLVSGGFTFFTERLKSRLGIDYTIANILEIRDGLLTGRVSGSIVEVQKVVNTAVEAR